MLRKALPNDISNRIFTEKLPLYSYYNALFVPQSPVGIDKKSGLYDYCGNLINQAAIFSGPENNLHIHVQEYKTNLHFQDGYPEVECLFWGGYFSDHYGHFLIETLPRLIRYSLIKNEGNIKIIFLSKKSKEELIKINWIKFLFEKIGISIDDVFIPLFPIKIKEVIFCSDYISEQNYANTESHRIFRSLSEQKFESRQSNPEEKKFAYISRNRLSSGTHKIINEEKIENTLSKIGVSIFYPEELSISDQVNIIEKYRCAGFIGSFFHNCVFASCNPEFLCLSYGENLNLNYSLLDFISNSRGDYYVPKTNVIEKTNDFYEVCEVDNIEQVSNFIVSWFNSNVERNPSYIIKEKERKYPNITTSNPLKIKDKWDRVAKISPHTGKLIFTEEHTSNDVLVDAIILSDADGKSYLVANSSYEPLIKLGKHGHPRKIIPISIKKKEGFFHLKDDQNLFLTSIPKNGYSVSEVKPCEPDEWEQFILTEYMENILLTKP